MALRPTLSSGLPFSDYFLLTRLSPTPSRKHSTVGGQPNDPYVDPPYVVGVSLPSHQQTLCQWGRFWRAQGAQANGVQNSA